MERSGVSGAYECGAEAGAGGAEAAAKVGLRLGENGVIDGV